MINRVLLILICDSKTALIVDFTTFLHSLSIGTIGNRVTVKSRSRVRIPPSAPKNAVHPKGGLLLLIHEGIRKAALSELPVAGRNRRGFSAEKESLLLRQNRIAILTR